MTLGSRVGQRHHQLAGAGGAAIAIEIEHARDPLDPSGGEIGPMLADATKRRAPQVALDDFG